MIITQSVLMIRMYLSENYSRYHATVNQTIHNKHKLMLHTIRQQTTILGIDLYIIVTERKRQLLIEHYFAHAKWQNACKTRRLSLSRTSKNKMGDRLCRFTRPTAQIYNQMLYAQFTNKIKIRIMFKFITQNNVKT